jgi:PadR family transcriptional regulator PadR
MAPAKLELLQGTLDLIVLKLLNAGPANGWDLTQSIQAVSRGVLDVNYGSLYPALRRLETKGWVTAMWAPSENNRRARYYELTASGRKQLARERANWERFANALGLILASG